jgi:adenine-specific DNA-methyltransferase
MNLKQALLNVLETEQLKDLCAELEVDADRRSPDAMYAALSSSRRAKLEMLIPELSVVQLRTVLREFEQPTDGKREELVERLLVVGGRAADLGEAAHSGRGASDLTAEYRHRDEAVQRPDAGVQDQFQAKKPPRVYRYDSSLDPSLSWDEQRERDLGEWLLNLIVRASKEGETAVFAEPQIWKGGGIRVASVVDAVQMVQQIAKPYLNWAGKAERYEIRVPTAPLFVHERHSTKAVLDGIRHRVAPGQTLNLFGHAGMDIRENLEAYEHKGPWQNRMILGDSLSVMNSLLEFEGLGGQVQMVYIDPPYGVKFGSNFQPFVRKRDVRHGGDEHMTREPEMVKAYRDTWELGLHSYLTYLRDRLMLARDLLHPSGSVFLQISDENLHHVRELMDEIFGAQNFVVIICFRRLGIMVGETLQSSAHYLLWYAHSKDVLKQRKSFEPQIAGIDAGDHYVQLEHSKTAEIRRMSSEERGNPELIPNDWKPFQLISLTTGGYRPNTTVDYVFEGKTYHPGPNKCWRTTVDGLNRLQFHKRIMRAGETIRYKQYLADFPLTELTSIWTDTARDPEKYYAVQTPSNVVRRCILMTTDPGDLVVDPTCGSGTTAYVAEQWGRRWITIDTSRVPLALARQRLLTATFPYYKLKIRQDGPSGGFVYQRKQNRKGEEVGGLMPHITLKSIANNEPPAVEVLVDRPEEVSGVTRVSGPFAVEATIAPVQPLETAGIGTSGDADMSTHIQRMTEVLRQSKTLRLPGNRELILAGARRTLDTEYLHAEAKEGDRRVAIVFGPADGAVSTTLVYEAGREAHYLKYDRLYFFGFAIEPGARSMIEDEKKLRIPAAYVAVTPDVAMSDLLKTTRASEIFSITGLPDVTVHRAKKKGPDGQPLYEVELKGLDVFDPGSMNTESIDGDTVPCWMLDTDYDKLCFYAAQVFFPKTSAWDNLQRSLGSELDESVWSHLAGTVSEPFALGERRRVAVKVIDERGNELMRVLDVAE